MKDGCLCLLRFRLIPGPTKLGATAKLCPSAVVLAAALLNLFCAGPTKAQQVPSGASTAPPAGTQAATLSPRMIVTAGETATFSFQLQEPLPIDEKANGYVPVNISAQFGNGVRPDTGHPFPTAAETAKWHPLSGNGSLQSDHQTLLISVRTERNQSPGIYRLFELHASIGSQGYDPPFNPTEFEVIPDETFQPFLPPSSISGTITPQPTKAQLLHAQVLILRRSLKQLDSDLTNMKNMAPVEVRSRLIRSVHDESSSLNDTELRYLKLTPEPRARDAAKITFADIQGRYDAVEKRLQGPILGSLEGRRAITVAFDLAGERATLSLIRADMVEAITLNVEGFNALADNGDYIPSVLVHTEPEQGAAVVCTTRAGPELRPSGLTNTEFEFFPYAHFHCKATKGAFVGDTAYNSDNDTHHLILIIMHEGR